MTCTRPTPLQYDEGLKVGYKWYDAEKKDGTVSRSVIGLSYTAFSYSGLKVSEGEKPSVKFTVKNTGKHARAPRLRRFTPCCRMPRTNHPSGWWALTR